ncbi:aldo/keto reductase [Syncephalis fuscata]|nr:aldo/keto reductase [Syncephalis fuscata]
MHQQSPNALRQFGRNGPMLSAVGLGCMTMSPSVENYKKDAAVNLQDLPVDLNDKNTASGLATLSHAKEINCALWDTADAFGRGHNEKLVAHALKKGRDKVFICTKFGYKYTDNNSVSVCGEPAYIRQCCEESLKRLDVDYIDMYYQHRIDPNVPIETSVAAMAELVHEGKVKHIGLVECSAETLRRAYKIHPITAIQVEYSPFVRDIEKNGVLDACKELGVAIVAYSPLGRGFLTGEMCTAEQLPAGDKRHLHPRFYNEVFTINLAAIEACQRMATTKNIKYLEGNVQAERVILSDDDEKLLREQVGEVDTIVADYSAKRLDFINA